MFCGQPKPLFPNGSVTDPALEEGLEELQRNINDIFLLVNGVVVSLMQAGFACLEAGSVHTKNTVNILMKNLMDMFVCGVCYYLVGYSLAYGTGNAVAGVGYWMGHGLPDSQKAKWFFQFVFAATAATIISGAVAERCNFSAYLIYSALISGVTYPIVSHWAWCDKGVLQKLGYVDFAGSGVIHAFSGACSFVAAALLGPRIGRFSDRNVNPLPGHSVPLTGLGGLLLLTGFLSFNGGSAGTSGLWRGSGAMMAQAMSSTVLGGSGAAAASLLLCRFWLGGSAPWPFSLTLNATLSGIVATCASANIMSSWAAFIAGAIACIVFYGLHYLVLKLRVDDPLDATAVHFGGGMVGVILQPVLNSCNGLIFKGSDALKHFGFNLLGLLVIVSWATITSLIIFGSLRMAGIFRISPDDELIGLDQSKHGEMSYDPKAWPWDSIVVNQISVEPNQETETKKFENMGFEEDGKR